MHVLILLSAPAIALALAAALSDGYSVPDASMTTTLSLPDGAATTISNGLDVGNPSKLASLPGNFEFTLTAPALSTTQLPDGQTITYSIVTGGNADLTVPTIVIPGVLMQTGAGGAGAAAATVTLRLPPEYQQFVGFQSVKSGSGDASAAIATLQANF